MAQRTLPNPTGRQKRQARLLRTRLKKEGMDTPEARTRAEATVQRKRGSAQPRVVSKRREVAIKGTGPKPPRSTKRRK